MQLPSADRLKGQLHYATVLFAVNCAVEEAFCTPLVELVSSDESFAPPPCRCIDGSLWRAFARARLSERLIVGRSEERSSAEGLLSIQFT